MVGPKPPASSGGKKKVKKQNLVAEIDREDRVRTKKAQKEMKRGGVGDLAQEPGKEVLIPGGGAMRNLP